MELMIVAKDLGSVSLKVTADEVSDFTDAMKAWAEAVRPIAENPAQFVEDCLDATAKWAAKNPDKAMVLLALAQMGQAQAAGFSPAADSMGGLGAFQRAQGAQGPNDIFAQIFGGDNNLK